MLLQKVAVLLESWDGGYYFCYFTVPKNDGKLRSILDLRDVNSYINTKKFRMVTLETILLLLKKGDWLL